MKEKKKTLNSLKVEMRKKASPLQARNLQRFFKTAKGEYAYGEKFIGIKVPNIRKIAKDYRGLEQRKVISLLKSPIHEERFIALLRSKKKSSIFT